MIEIRRVGAERRHDLVDTLVAAFSEDPFLGWLLAESPYEPPEARLRWWNGALQAMEAVAEIHATQDSSAVAVWLPPRDGSGGLGEGEEGDAGAFLALVRDVCGGGADERLEFLAELEAAMPTEPHWHLTAVGVSPDAQNRGLGRKVLTPMLDRCDRLGVPAYLEATTTRSRQLYERLGFVLLAPLERSGGPALALMWREPRG